MGMLFYSIENAVTDDNDDDDGDNVIIHALP